MGGGGAWGRASPPHNTFSGLVSKSCTCYFFSFTQLPYVCIYIYTIVLQHSFTNFFSLIIDTWSMKIHLRECPRYFPHQSLSKFFPQCERRDSMNQQFTTSWLAQRIIEPRGKLFRWFTWKDFHKKKAEHLFVCREKFMGNLTLYSCTKKISVCLIKENSRTSHEVMFYLFRVNQEPIQDDTNSFAKDKLIYNFAIHVDQNIAFESETR